MNNERVQISYRFKDETLYKLAKKMAEQRNQSLNGLITSLLEKEINKSMIPEWMDSSKQAS